MLFGDPWIVSAPSALPFASQVALFGDSPPWKKISTPLVFFGIQPAVMHSPALHSVSYRKQIASPPNVAAELAPTHFAPFR